MPSEALQECDTRIVPIALRFHGRHLEDKFLEWYYEISLPQIRRGLLIAIGLFAVFGCLDWGLTPSVVHRLWVVRYAILCPLIIAAYAFTYSRHFRPYMQVSVAGVTILSGLGIVAMTAIAPAPLRYFYYAGICLVAVYAYTILRLRFLYATAVAVAVSAAYVISAVRMQTPLYILLNNVFFVATFDVVGAAAGYALEMYLRKIFVQMQRVEDQSQELRRQEELAESLLLNTLPAGVADELKLKGKVEPRFYDDVTVLFTDFKAFTCSTEGLAAEELVRRLHDYFSSFDHITTKYGIEKLKTIGDSYMCVGGLPSRSDSHAVDCVLAAFEILDEVEKRKMRQTSNWSIRIGLHTGPVICGIVGTRKFAFDIWGASVNFASRMESSGSEGKVNISASTYEKVKDFFICEYRGKVSTKEHREYDMYFVTGVQDTLLDDEGSPIPEPFLRRYFTYFHKDLEHFPESLRYGVANPPSSMGIS